jgi:alcohol dehydrogenase (cytochrome c)
MQPQTLVRNEGTPDMKGLSALFATVAAAFALSPSTVYGQIIVDVSTTPVFTTAQAQHGQDVYMRTCASCHGESLTGGTAPSLSGVAFQGSWSHPDMKLDDLLFLVSTTMPPNSSFLLTEQDHADVVAYILESNGIPAGPTALAVGAEGLAQPFPWAGKFRSSAAGVSAGNDQVANRAASEDFIQGDPTARPGSTGPDQATLNAAVQSTDWLIHTHDYAGTRHSPLDQLNAENVSRIAPTCLFQVAEATNFQTGPIIYNGVMYLTTRASTIAIDAASCKPKWKETWTPRGDTVWERNRGVAIKDGYLVRGTPDGYLLAMSSETGTLLWARRVANAEAGETFTMAPVIYEDMILIGPAGSENNIQGWVGAFRLSDGASVWRFNTVPKPDEPGYETWNDPAGIPMGGGAVWTSFAVDIRTGDLHAAATNPSPDLPVHLRRGSNLYTNSLLVLDVHTGKLRWHRQVTPNDSHDWDLTHATPIIEAAVNGVTRRLAVTAGKDGMLRTFDRDTQELVYSTPVTSIENADVPITTEPTRACPGHLGGVEWNGPAYNPEANMLYVNAVDWCTTFTAFQEIRHIPGKTYMGGTVELDPLEQSRGWLSAIDASTGAVAWQYESPRPMVAAVTTTAGNLVLTGELGGDFLVFDTRTGRELYRFNTGGSMGGGVVTYAVDGRQYIAAASGSPSSFWVDEYPGAPTIVVFSLPL